MERLTEKRNGKNVIPLRNAIMGVGLPGWSIDKRSNIERFLSGDAADRLAHYEDLEERGRLVELPCGVGDTLFDIYEAKGNGEGNPRELKVTDMHIHLDKRNKAWLIVGGYYLSIDDFGKTVFLSRPEAEAALAASGKEG